MDKKTYDALNSMTEAPASGDLKNGRYVIKPLKIDMGEKECEYNAFKLWTNDRPNVCVYLFASDSPWDALFLTFVSILAFALVIACGTMGPKWIKRIRERRKQRKIEAAAYSGIDMTPLTKVRIELKKLKMHEILGCGAFADVCRGTFQDEVVAVKVLQSNRTSLQQLKAFVDEINLMASFDSPYIVKLIGAAWTRPLDILCVMEFMDSGDLKNYLDSHKKLSWAEKILHLLCIAEVPQRLAGLDERDPVDRFWHFKRRYSSYNDGTFRWMAPEVLKDEHYTIAADIYSLGVIMSELDTHSIPYHDIRNPTNSEPISDHALIGKVLAGEVTPTFTDNCPRWFLDMAKQCLRHNPLERPTAMQISHIVRGYSNQFEEGGFV
ncbi:hypothetical protein AeRB84_000267 [Aphanomyces euteiches]|nr:hypothetical protein AeRB84_000267 [Aphanomyces euteiches]